MQENTTRNSQENPVIFEAYVTNLGKYNEGELVGEWVEFPTTTEHMQDVFKRIGIDGKHYEEHFMTDYNLPAFNSELYNILGEYESINELNFLAQCMEESGIDPQKLNALLEIQTPSNIGDVINAIENQDCYNLLSDVYTNEDLGYYYVEESGIYDLSAMSHLANYIDKEQQKEKSKKNEKPSLRQTIETIKNNQKGTQGKDACAINKDSQER